MNYYLLFGFRQYREFVQGEWLTSDDQAREWAAEVAHENPHDSWQIIVFPPHASAGHEMPFTPEDP